MIKRHCFVTVILVLFSSCSTDIGKIREYQDEYVDKDVSIKGEVEMVIPLTPFYQIKDESGEIFVKAKSHLPETGSKYNVKGYLRKKEISVLNSFLANGIYIEETERSLN
jgi:hypothetical protein